MRYLSLFSGAGGGDLACSHLLGWHCIGYVEWDDYCQQLIARRIKDGHLDKAPIYSDIRAFASEGYANMYQGLVDTVIGGFPCQPFSSAGEARGADDPRNMWPATRDVLCAVRPRWALLENVSGLLAGGSDGYFGTILRDLHTLGFDVRWQVLSAKEVGAPHQRERLWIVAHANGQ
jgi:DNA (cytosine-5)-methyltransferase 1